jgi:hypothetical protein
LSSLISIKEITCGKVSKCHHQLSGHFSISFPNQTSVFFLHFHFAQPEENWIQHCSTVENSIFSTIKFSRLNIFSRFNIFQVDLIITKDYGDFLNEKGRKRAAGTWQTRY